MQSYFNKISEINYEGNISENDCISNCSTGEDDEVSCTQSNGIWYSYSWVQSVGTPNISQTGADGEPLDDDLAIGCTNEGVSQLGDYSDCNNSVANSSVPLIDYGAMNWNHDGVDYEEAFCMGFMRCF